MLKFISTASGINEKRKENRKNRTHLLVLGVDLVLLRKRERERAEKSGRSKCTTYANEPNWTYID